MRCSRRVADSMGTRRRDCAKLDYSRSRKRLGRDDQTAAAPLRANRLRARIDELSTIVRNAIPAALARGLAWQYVGNFGSALLSGGFLLLIGRRLGVTEFGLYSVCVAAATIAFSLSEMRLQEVTIKFLAEYRSRQDAESAAAFIKLTYVFDLALRLVAFLIVVGLDSWINVHLAKSTGSAYFIVLAAAGFLLGRAGSTPALGVLRIGNRFDLHAQALLAEGTTKFLVYGILDFIWGPSIQIALIAALLGPLVSNVMIQVGAMRVVLKWALPIGSASVLAMRTRTRELLKFVLSSYSISLFDVVVREFDTAIVAWYLSLADVGLYRMAKSFALLIWKAGDPIFFVVMPEFAKLWSEGRGAELKQLVQRLTRLLALMAIIILPAAYLLMPAVVRAILGAQYLSILQIFPIASWWIVVSLPLIWTHPLAYAIGRPQLQLIANVFGNLIGLGLLIALTRSFGVVGAAMGLSCSYAATFLIAWFVLQQHYRSLS